MISSNDYNSKLFVMIILNMALSVILGMILFINFKNLSFSNNMNIMRMCIIQF